MSNTISLNASLRPKNSGERSSRRDFTIIARRFNAGDVVVRFSSPEGTADQKVRIINRPFGTRFNNVAKPGVETPGYYHSFLRNGFARYFNFRTAFPIFTFIFIFISTLLVRAVEWESLPSLLEGGGNFVCGTLDDDLILIGGIGWKNDVKQWRDPIWRFDANKTNWIETGKLPVAIAYAAFGETKEGIYFAGGSDGQKTHETLRLLNRKFELRTIAKFQNPLCYSGFAVADGKLFVVSGGTDANDLKTLTNLFYAMDLRTGKTTSLPAYPGGKILIPAAAMIGKNFYVFGGASWDSAHNHAINTDSAFVYSISDKIWKTIKPYPFVTRGLASCVLDERYILLGGGYRDAFTDFAVIYDTKTDSYLKTKPLPSKAMANFIKAGDFIYWIGGEHAMRQRSDSVHRIPWKTLLQETLEE